MYPWTRFFDTACEINTSASSGVLPTLAGTAKIAVQAPLTAATGVDDSPPMLGVTTNTAVMSPQNAAPSTRSTPRTRYVTGFILVHPATAPRAEGHDPVERISAELAELPRPPRGEHDRLPRGDGNPGHGFRADLLERLGHLPILSLVLCLHGGVDQLLDALPRVHRIPDSREDDVAGEPHRPQGSGRARPRDGGAAPGPGRGEDEGPDPEQPEEPRLDEGDVLDVRQRRIERVDAKEPGLLQDPLVRDREVRVHPRQVADVRQDDEHDCHDDERHPTDADGGRHARAGEDGEEEEAADEERREGQEGTDDEGDRARLDLEQDLLVRGEEFLRELARKAHHPTLQPPEWTGWGCSGIRVVASSRRRRRDRRSRRARPLPAANRGRLNDRPEHEHSEPGERRRQPAPGSLEEVEAAREQKPSDRRRDDADQVVDEVIRNPEHDDQDEQGGDERRIHLARGERRRAVKESVDGRTGEEPDDEGERHLDELREQDRPDDRADEREDQRGDDAEAGPEQESDRAPQQRPDEGHDARPDPMAPERECEADDHEDDADDEGGFAGDHRNGAGS